MNDEITKAIEAAKELDPEKTYLLLVNRTSMPIASRTELANVFREKGLNVVLVAVHGDPDEVAKLYGLPKVNAL